jgi:CRISPR-associated protein Csb2
VTPAALPEPAARRRIDPKRLTDRSEQKSARERQSEEGRAIEAVCAAVRHIGLGIRPASAQVQREPFLARGTRAEAFAPGTRFAKERLWHVEIVFPEPVQGPLVLGDGRYLGLGLLQPIGGDLLVFGMPAEPRIAFDRRDDLLRAVRRALMACARRDDGGVPRLFSGHEPDGSAAASGRHDHIFLAAADLDRDGWLDRLLVAAPWVCDRSVRATDEAKALFKTVVSELRHVRAGPLGVLELDVPLVPHETHALVGPSRIWESHTRYGLTRHAKRRTSMSDAVRADVRTECQRRGLPMPVVEVDNAAFGPPEEPLVRLRLRFPDAIEGPILLGRDSHRGGGLFLASR